MTEQHASRVLLALVRRRWDEAERLVGEEPLDPDGFTRACVEADIHPGLHALLVRHDRAALVGDEILSRLQRLRTKVAQGNLLLFARAEQALDRLAAAGVTPLALKGFDLLHRVYERIDERTSDDVDLLVRPGELQPALEALLEAGWEAPPEPRRTHYIRSSHHLPLRSPGPLPVDLELHWNLAQENRFRVDLAGIYSRARPLRVSGRDLLRMDDHDLVAHLLLHHFTHYFDRRLKWLEDLRRIARLPGFDWKLVVQRIRAWRAVVATGISARHLRKLDPEVIPQSVAHELPVGGLRLALVAPLRSDHPQELFRGTRRRWVQLYLAAVMLEQPSRLPAWLLHRKRRDRRRGANPLDREDASRAPGASNGDSS